MNDNQNEFSMQQDENMEQDDKDKKDTYNPSLDTETIISEVPGLVTMDTEGPVATDECSSSSADSSTIKRSSKVKDALADHAKNKEPMFGAIQALRRGSQARFQEIPVDFLFTKNSVAATIAKNSTFEYTTLAIITINAVWIGYDADTNKGNGTIAGSLMLYVGMENFFCFYFTFEVCLRFLAFSVKKYMFKDAWFMFDSFLVIAMVFETWIMPLMGGAGGAGGLSILRLLRLLRLTRMVRLMRAMPELLTLIKGMVAAARSVSVTLVLLVIVVYIFSIILVMQERYHDIGWAMYNLFMGGTLLDNVTDVLREIKDSSTLELYIFMFFILISSFTILNMLIGVLCEVAAATKEGEREKANWIDASTKITKVFGEIDEDGSGLVSHREFELMKDKEEVLDALAILDVEPKHLLALSDALFEPDDDAIGAECAELSFEEFLEVVCHMRPGKNASVLDIAQFTKSLRKSSNRFAKELGILEQRLKMFHQMVHAKMTDGVELTFDDLKKNEIAGLQAKLEIENQKKSQAETVLKEAKRELKRLKELHDIKQE